MSNLTLKTHKKFIGRTVAVRGVFTWSGVEGLPERGQDSFASKFLQMCQKVRGGPGDRHLLVFEQSSPDSAKHGLRRSPPEIYGDPSLFGFLRVRLCKPTKSEHGFSLVELIVVMVLTLLFSGLVLTFMFSFWRSGATLQNDLTTFTGRLNAGDRIRDLINSSSGFMTQNGMADAHVLSADPADPTGQYWTAIHAIPGNKTVGASGSYTPLVYFKAPSVTSSKTIIMNGSQPYEDEFIFYLDGTTKELRMRTLANTAASGNRAKTSCPPASASSSCPVDAVIAENLSSIDMRYFSRSGNLIDYTSITDPLTGEFIGPDFPSVEVVEFNLHVFKKGTVSGSQDTSSQTIIRVALRNT